jgi:hypothetical protein
MKGVYFDWKVATKCTPQKIVRCVQGVKSGEARFYICAQAVFDPEFLWYVPVSLSTGLDSIVELPKAHRQNVIARVLANVGQRRDLHVGEGCGLNCTALIPALAQDNSAICANIGNDFTERQHMQLRDSARPMLALNYPCHLESDMLRLDKDVYIVSGADSLDRHVSGCVEAKGAKEGRSLFLVGMPVSRHTHQFVTQVVPASDTELTLTPNAIYIPQNMRNILVRFYQQKHNQFETLSI